MLEGKTVVVCGVGPGLGGEVARLALRDGANVVIAARWSGKLKAVVQGTVVNLIIAVIVVTQIVGWEPRWIKVQTISWWLMLVATLVTLSLVWWSGWPPLLMIKGFGIK